MVLAIIAVSAWYAAITTDAVAAKVVEDEMYEANLATKMVPENEEKRTQPDPVLNKGAEVIEIDVIEQ